MKNTIKKLLGVVLALCLLCSVLPITVFAEGEITTVSALAKFLGSCSVSGKTISLTKNIDKSVKVEEDYFESVFLELNIPDVTIDFNGYVLAGVDFYITGGNYTLTNTSDNVESGMVSASCITLDGGKLTVKDGLYSSDWSAGICIFNGTAEIYGGGFYGCPDGIYLTENGRLTVYDGYFGGEDDGLFIETPSSVKNVVLKGGVFEASEESEYGAICVASPVKSAYSPADFLADGFKLSNPKISSFTAEDFVFKCTETYTEVVPKHLAGDVNIDGKVNSGDALLVLQHSVGSTTLTGAALSSADVNRDSKCNSTDALMILQYSVGLIDKF